MKLQTILKSASGLAAIGLVGGFIAACGPLVEGDGRSLQPLSSQMTSQLRAMGSSPGEAMMIRIYKQDSQLEVWKRTGDGSYDLFKTYEICTYSGDIGPKLAEGDRQSPEGFYTISRGLMNPNSNFYLSFNLGFPNKFDRAHGRTGSHLMVHGDCSSRGCYAMTDEQIAEIYALARETFTGGNRSFQVQIYPFRMTPQNLARQADSPNLAYWQNLKTGFDHTEATGTPPTWDVCGGEYVFNASAQSGQALDARGACPTLNRNESIEARVNARQTADQATYEVAVAEFRSDTARREEEAARRAAEALEAAARKEANDIAVAQRSEAVNQAMQGVGDVVGGFFGSLFGGGGDGSVVENVSGVEINTTLVAPVPHPRISRG